MVAKPTPEETRNAIETLVNFSMFTESGEIGDIAVKALVEKELYRSMKQMSISDFFKKL